MNWMRWVGVVAAGWVLAAAVGCRKGASRQDKMVAAINHFYEDEPACLWYEPVEMPVEVDAADMAGRAGLDALVDQGVLVRTMLDADAENGAGVRYQLTETGERVWHPEAGHAGFGNICYGSTRVVEVGSVVEQHDEKLGDVADVSYLTELGRPPVWAMSPAVEGSFPRLQMELRGRMPGSARLKEVGADWTVVGAPTHSLGSSSPGSRDGSEKGVK